MNAAKKYNKSWKKKFLQFLMSCECDRRGNHECNTIWLYYCYAHFSPSLVFFLMRWRFKILHLLLLNIIDAGTINASIEFCSSVCKLYRKTWHNRPSMIVVPLQKSFVRSVGQVQKHLSYMCIVCTCVSFCVFV